MKHQSSERRDRFAAAALTGVLISRAIAEAQDPDCEWEIDAEEVAWRAAEAMLSLEHVSTPLKNADDDELE